MYIASSTIVLEHMQPTHFERLLDYYSLLLNLIKEASIAGNRNGFLTQAYIEEMTRVLPLSKQTLWREREACILPDEHDEAFLTFVNDRRPQIADKAHKVRRILPIPTPLPIDAARSGSVGGKHSRGKGTRKNAYTVPVQRGNKVKKSARAGDYPARIRRSNPARIVDSRASLHRREARTHFPESAVRSRISRPGQMEDMSIHRVLILPALILTGAPRLQRSQAYDCNKTSTPLERHSSLESESAAMTA
jgi:hypothetical protein